MGALVIPYALLATVLPGAVAPGGTDLPTPPIGPDLAEILDGVAQALVGAALPILAVVLPLTVLACALVGALIGFLTGMLGPVLLVLAASDDVVAGWLTLSAFLVSSVVASSVLGVLYAGYRILTERWRLELSGARRPSRREAALLDSVMADCLVRLGLARAPVVLVDDTRTPNAYSGTRHVVLTRGLLDEFAQDREVLAAVLSHEVTHWRNADAVSDAVIRGVALPVYVPYALYSWAKALVTSVGGNGVVTSLARAFLWLLAWPFILTVAVVIVPAQRSASRRAEYQADAGAVMAGWRGGLRQVLTRYRDSFDGARDGWDATVAAEHPPNELRLERVEEPGVSYPFPDPGVRSGAPDMVAAGGLTRD